MMPAEPEPWIETVLRGAAEQGEFDNLPLGGLPIADLDSAYQPGWWVRRFLERDRARGDDALVGGAHLIPGALSSSPAGLGVCDTRWSQESNA